MGQIGSLVSFAPNTIIRSADHNSNNNTIKTTYNTHDAATSGMHGITGSFVGTSDTQTLTNKTLTAPTINDLTLTGTVAFTSTNTTTNPFSLTANSLTTATGLAITANALTSGSGLTVTSTSTSTTVRPLVKFYNNAATAAATSTVLTVESSAANGHLLLLSNTNSSSANPLLLGKLVTSATSDFVNFTQNDVERFSVTAAGSVEITSVNTTAQHAMVIVGSQTTKNALDVTADSLTTGYVGSFVSNSADTSLRYIIFGRNDHASATGVIVAKFRQDSTGNILECTNSSGTEVLAVSPTTAAITGLATITSTTTTSNVCTITADSLTTGSALRVYSNSSSSGVRNLVQIINDNSSAANTQCLNLQQDSNADCLTIQMASSTTGHAIEIISGGVGLGLRIEIDGNLSGGDIYGIEIDGTNAGTGDFVAIDFTDLGAGGSGSEFCFQTNATAGVIATSTTNSTGSFWIKDSGGTARQVPYF